MINFQYLCIFKEKPRTLHKKTLRNQYLKFANWNFAIFKVSNCTASASDFENIVQRKKVYATDLAGSEQNKLFMVIFRNNSI